MATHDGAQAPGAEALSLNIFNMRHCDLVSQMDSLAMDSRISIKTRILLRIHTMRCKQCRSAAQQFRVLRRAAQRFHQDRLLLDGPCLSGSTAIRIGTALQRDSRPGALPLKS